MPRKQDPTMKKAQPYSASPQKEKKLISFQQNNYEKKNRLSKDPKSLARRAISQLKVNKNQEIPE